MTTVPPGLHSFFKFDGPPEANNLTVTIPCHRCGTPAYVAVLPFPLTQEQIRWETAWQQKFADYLRENCQAFFTPAGYWDPVCESCQIADEAKN